MPSASISYRHQWLFASDSEEGAHLDRIFSVSFSFALILLGLGRRALLRDEAVCFGSQSRELTTSWFEGSST